MKGLGWVGAFVAAGIAVGVLGAALMPARYRAVTAVHIEAARDSDVTFAYRLNAQLDDWPRFANLVIDALEHDREIEDPSILEYFVRKPRSPSALSRLIARIKARLFRPGPSP